jgi:hypothetical protein
MDLGGWWYFLFAIYALIFASGIRAAWLDEKRHLGERLMALSALCAGITAMLFVLSPDAPVIISSPMDVVNTIGGWVDSLVKEVLGG